MNDNKIKKYNEMIYSSRPVKFTEYITNQYDKIHDELYTDALNKFLDDVSNNIDKFEQFKNYSDKTDIIENTKIFEIKMKEYWMPSSILVMCKKYPYRTHNKRTISFVVCNYECCFRLFADRY